MTKLLIRFLDEHLNQLSWSIFDDEQETTRLNWQGASTEKLTSVAAQNPYPVVILIPQQCVYLTQIEIPEKAGRQVLATIEFQIEDQLAQDIDSLHFAVADAGQNPVSVAVVAKSVMTRCLALASDCNLRLIQVVPEIFLCPWSGDGVALMASGDDILLRYGDYSGFKCQASVLPTMLELIKREVEFDQIRLFRLDTEIVADLEPYSTEVVTVDEARSGLTEGSLIDLRQREFQAASAWRGVGRAWRWVAILATVLLVVGGYNRFAELQDMEAEIAAIQMQQFDTVRLYLPADTDPNSDLKRQVISRLKQLQDGQNKPDFMQLLMIFSQAQKQYPVVKVDRIGYQDGTLNVDLTSAQLKEIEALHAAIQDQGVDAKLNNLNIKPELISGRLVMRGGGDG